jgi:hypothetical protein
MRHMRSDTSFFALSIVAALFVVVMLVAPPEASAQATISTGSVQGAILDPKGTDAGDLPRARGSPGSQDRRADRDR